MYKVTAKGFPSKCEFTNDVKDICDLLVGYGISVNDAKNLSAIAGFMHWGDYFYSANPDVLIHCFKEEV